MPATIRKAIGLSKDVPDEIYEGIVELIEGHGYKLFPSKSSPNTDESQYQYFDLIPKKATQPKKRSFEDRKVTGSEVTRGLRRPPP